MTDLLPSDLHSLGLDRFQTYDDRQAALTAVRVQLKPPDGLSQQVQEWRAQAASGERQRTALRRKGTKPFDGPQGAAMEAVARQAATQVLDVAVAGMKDRFCDHAIAMLGWATRLRWHEPNEDWNPALWAAEAAAMGASPRLLETIIEHASTASWKTWQRVMDVSNDWESHWQSWERAFGRTPALALRWLDVLLRAPQGPTIDAVRATRARAWQQTHLAEQAGRPTGLWRELDTRLAVCSEERDLRRADWSLFFHADLPTSGAGDRLHRFFATCPADTSRWLSLPAHPGFRARTARLSVGRPDADTMLVMLKAWSDTGVAGPHEITAWLQAWARLPTQVGAGAMLNEEVYRAHGVEPLKSGAVSGLGRGVGMIPASEPETIPRFGPRSLPRTAS